MNKRQIFHVDGYQTHIFKWNGILPLHVKNKALRDYKKKIGYYAGVTLQVAEPREGITEWQID